MSNLLNVLDFLSQVCNLGDEETTKTVLGVLYYVKLAVKILRVVVPFGLILLGTIDMAKSVIAGDEKKVKEAQKPFIKRIIAAIIVFLIPTIVNAIVEFAAPNSQFVAGWGDEADKLNISDTIDADK